MISKRRRLVGQMELIQAYEQAFQAHGLQTAQVLLDNGDLSDRQRYLNAGSTLTTLLKLGVITVVNENDTVATDEIRFGDNDTLAALVANLIQADLLGNLNGSTGHVYGGPAPGFQCPVDSSYACRRSGIGCHGD